MASQQRWKAHFNGSGRYLITKSYIDLYWQTSSFHKARESHSETFIILVFFDLFHLDGASVKANAIVLDLHVANLFENLLVAFRTVIAHPSLYLRIENTPYMALVIEATGDSGPMSLPLRVI